MAAKGVDNHAHNGYGLQEHTPVGTDRALGGKAIALPVFGAYKMLLKHKAG